MNKNSKIYISGHTGLLGSAIYSKLTKLGYTNLIVSTSKELDLRNIVDVDRFFHQRKPDIVINCAAKVGGIQANIDSPYDFLNENILIQTNILNTAVKYDVSKLLFFGSSCIYPTTSTIPIRETEILLGNLEHTNEAYALAKITGLKQVQYINQFLNKNYISLMPTNLYGNNDNYDLNNSHVIPALIRKFHEAKIFNYKEVEIWGTGEPLREFLHVDDLADAAIFVLKKYSSHEFMNVGSGEEISIKDLAYLISEIVEYKGKIVFNTKKPNGVRQKLLDSSKINKMGWSAKIKLNEGLRSVYKNFKANYEEKIKL